MFIFYFVQAVRPRNMRQKKPSKEETKERSYRVSSSREPFNGLPFHLRGLGSIKFAYEPRRVARNYCPFEKALRTKPSIAIIDYGRGK